MIADVSATTPAGKHITRYRQMTGLIFVSGKGDGGGRPGGGNGSGDECKEARDLIRRLAAFVERCCAHKEKPPQGGIEGPR